ncbi:MAG TPA: hypothetical protein VGB37_09505 [Candidatus Lokiarchaeia archaeon]
MEKEVMITFRVIKIRKEDGKIIYCLEIPKEDGNDKIKGCFTYSTLEQLADGINDYFDYNFYCF